MRKQILAAGAVAAAMTSTLVATPAQAASYTCSPGYVCLWTDLNYDGTRQQISDRSDYSDLNSSLHDKASSWGSSGTHRFCIVNFVGGQATTIDDLWGGERVPWVGSAANDKADAIRWC